MFYPDIFRRLNYSTNNKGEPHSSYKGYREEITEDCNYRCVYCDITLEEMGFEGMQLDHFQPQKHFPELKSDPTNLVLSCPKCNRLKSSHWPPEDSGFSFLNPFESERMQHFSIEESGVVSPTSTQAASYQIELLFLNRHARILSRRKRTVQYKKKAIQQAIEAKLAALMDNMEQLDTSEVAGELKTIKSVFSLLRTLN